jgi:hypothetical protein
VESLSEAGFAEQAELLSVTNPKRLLAGDAPLSVPPIEMPKNDQTLWERVMGSG